MRAHEKLAFQRYVHPRACSHLNLLLSSNFLYSLHIHPTVVADPSEAERLPRDHAGERCEHGGLRCQGGESEPGLERAAEGAGTGEPGQQWPPARRCRTSPSSRLTLCRSWSPRSRRRMWKARRISLFKCKNRARAHTAIIMILAYYSCKFRCASVHVCHAC